MPTLWHQLCRAHSVVPVRRRSQGSLPYRPQLDTCLPNTQITSTAYARPLQQTKVLPKLHLPNFPLHNKTCSFYYHPTEIQDSHPLPPSTQLIHVPTRRPAYTCLHQPACLPAGHLQNLNPPHLPSPTALASRHHQVLPSCLSMSPPVCLHLPTPACLPTPARPLPYLPPSYQLPTLSILPSCAMAKVRRFIMAGLYDHISHEMHM